MISTAECAILSQVARIFLACPTNRGGAISVEYGEVSVFIMNNATPIMYIGVADAIRGKSSSPRVVQCRILNPRSSTMVHMGHRGRSGLPDKGSLVQPVGQTDYRTL